MHPKHIVPNSYQIEGLQVKFLIHSIGVPHWCRTQLLLNRKSCRKYFKCGKIKHFSIIIQLKNREIRLVLISGCSHTIISHDIAKFLQGKITSKENIISENMHGDEHYDAHKCEFILPQNTKLSAYSVNTQLCPIEMEQTLINKFWPNLEENIMHDVMKTTFNGPADILTLYTPRGGLRGPLSLIHI